MVCTASWAEVRESCTIFDRPWADLRYPDDLEQRVRGTWAALDPSGALGAECWTAVAREASAWDAADKEIRDRDRAHVLGQMLGYVGSPERSAATLKHWGAADRGSANSPRG